jgi:integrase/recombinase XerD
MRKMSENQNESCADLRKRSAVILHSPESGIKEPSETTRQADSDDQLMALWLHGRPDHTQRPYRTESDRFIGYVEKPLRSVKLIDIQSFADHLGEAGLKPSSVHRAMSAVKSLFAFGFRLGYLQFDVGRALKIPGFRDQLAERILSETEVLRIISLEPNPRNRAILLTLYAGGFRVSEICSLKWRHLQERNETGQITVFGKGDKTRTVLMPRSVWEALQIMRGDSSDDAPVFKSRKKGHLDESQVWRIVTKAAERAGIDKDVSCHWFRHAHASHALDRGCPIHLVQATLGHSSVATTGKYLHARPSDSSGNYLPF